jgi:hypothetical protein
MVAALRLRHTAWRDRPVLQPFADTTLRTTTSRAKPESRRYLARQPRYKGTAGGMSWRQGVRDVALKRRMYLGRPRNIIAEHSEAGAHGSLSRTLEPACTTPYGGSPAAMERRATKGDKRA